MGLSQSAPTPEQLQKDKEHAEKHTLIRNKDTAKSPNFAEFSETLAEKTTESDFERFQAFRNELLAFSLGESAFDYAERLYAAQPDNKQVMALLAETACLYDGTKNKHMKGHWVDRLDLLQRAIDVSRKCIKDNPDFQPCYRTYVVAATRASESLYYYRWMRGMGLAENYNAIMKRGEESLDLEPHDALVLTTLGSLTGRCSQFTRFPYNVYSWYQGVPSRQRLLEKSIDFNTRALEVDPGSMEAMVRLGQAYYQADRLADARRCFSAVRDEMVPRSLSDAKYQDQAHTMLAAGFETKTKWNMRFS